MSKIMPTKAEAKFILAVVDAGLSNGIGSQEPGEMCVEAAVNYGLGGDHNDAPECVYPKLRDFKIDLNDGLNWNDKKERSRGLRRLAIAQLGSREMNWKRFTKLFGKWVRQEFIPNELEKFDKLNFLDHILIKMLRKNISPEDYKVVAGALSFGGVEMVTDFFIARHPSIFLSHICDDFGIKDTKDLRARYCEGAVQVLVKMHVPGTKYLLLTKAPPKKQSIKSLIAQREKAVNARLSR